MQKNIVQQEPSLLRESRFCVYEPLSELLASPIISPIVVPYRMPYKHPCKEVNAWLIL